jgi:DNA-3-methyladenine glycosylase
MLKRCSQPSKNDLTRYWTVKGQGYLGPDGGWLLAALTAVPPPILVPPFPVAGQHVAKMKSGMRSGNPTVVSSKTPREISGRGARHGTLMPRAFFERPPDTVARAVLGKLLIRRSPDALLVGRIVEVEAYIGDGDPAAHAAAGRTARNSVLFGPAGHAYVYFIYGMHSCLNISCELAGQAGSLLVRALEPLQGLAEMAAWRGLSAHASPRLLTSGPGRLCQAFGITRATHNGVDLLSKASDLQLRDDGYETRDIVTTPRIGITKAAERPLRFLVAGNACVSGPARANVALVT